MEDKISEFLKKMGMKSDQSATPNQWDSIIQPKSSYLLTGDVGTGKSAWAYWAMETYGQKYGLTPTVVGLPRNKRHLLPDTFDFISGFDEIAARENAIVFIDEADIQLPLDSNKNKEQVVNFLSLPRQRKQIFILAYHFPRLVKGTYLPFFSGFLFKRPPYLIEFATKQGSAEMLKMMERANERFDELPIDQNEKVIPGEHPVIIKKSTYVVAPRIRWQGMLENPLASFWTQELSEIWSGTEVGEGTKQPKLFTEIEEYLKGKRELEEETRPEAFAIEAQYSEGQLVAFNVADPDGAVIRERAKLIAEVCQQYPQFTPEQLRDAKIIYGDYHARLELG